MVIHLKGKKLQLKVTNSVAIPSEVRFVCQKFFRNQDLVDSQAKSLT